VPGPAREILDVRLKQFSLRYPTMKPLVIVLRLVIAAALILPISIRYADSIVLVLMPLYRYVFELISDEYRITFFGLAAQGVESVIRVDVGLAHPVVVGGHLFWPDPRGMAHVSTLAVQAMQPAATALIAALGWPCLSLRRWFYRLLSLALFVLLITALDVPFLLAGEIWGMLIDNISPGTGSALVSWSQFLVGGGRPALGIFAALASLAVENFFAKSAPSTTQPKGTIPAS
jgi:hypothetical protein